MEVEINDINEFYMRLAKRPELVAIDPVVIKTHLNFFGCYIYPMIDAGHEIFLPGIGLYCKEGKDIYFTPSPALSLAGIIHQALSEELHMIEGEQHGRP